MDEDGKINKQLLKCHSGEFEIESIHSLNLKAAGVSDLGCLGECIGLEILDLSFNDISKLHILAGLTNLGNLNLSANRITSLEGLQSLDNLQVLNLSGNLIGRCPVDIRRQGISSVDALHCLSGLEKLRELRLQNVLKDLTNPVCLNTSYRDQVLAILPNLVVLDGERLSGRGSELFRICREIDAALDSTQNEGDFQVPPSEPWVSLSTMEPSREFESSNLADADQQLTALLSECRRVSTQADELLRLRLKEANVEVT